MNTFMSSTRTPMRAPSILIVCDDSAVRALLRTALALEGHDVLAFGDATATPDVARDWRPDLVVLDVRECGGATGWDAECAAACWRLRTDPATRRIPVLLLGGVPAHDENTVGPVAGPGPLLPVAARLPKPFDLAELYRAVAALTAAPGAGRTAP